jgi:hypothetical protein
MELRDRSAPRVPPCGRMILGLAMNVLLILVSDFWRTPGRQSRGCIRVIAACISQARVLMRECGRKCRRPGAAFEKALRPCMQETYHIDQNPRYRNPEREVSFVRHFISGRRISQLTSSPTLHTPQLAIINL